MNGRKLIHLNKIQKSNKNIDTMSDGAVHAKTVVGRKQFNLKIDTASEGAVHAKMDVGKTKE